MKNSNTQDQATTSRIGSATPVVESQAPPERNASVDSAAFFEGDEYDDYDDFQAAGGSGGGAVGNNGNIQFFAHWYQIILQRSCH